MLQETPILAKDTDAAKAIYEQSFPVEEQIPFQSICKAAKADANFFASGFYDDKELVGFSAYYVYNKVVYVLYLAVSSNSQKKGYGTEILSHIKEKYAPKSIALDVEPIDDLADNAAQRIRRKAFYVKNGFKESTFCLRYSEGNELFDLLYYGDMLGKEELHELFTNCPVKEFMPGAILDRA